MAAAERHRNSTAVDARDMTRPQEREARHTRRLVEAVFARWVRVRRFRRAARDFLRAGGCVEINQCVGCTPRNAAVPPPSGGEEPAPSRYRAGVVDGVEDDTTIQDERAVKF